MSEFILIGIAVIIFAILIKVGLKVLKWGIIALVLYALWRIVMH
jgi:hypothetical protein